ncbi:MAG: efflux RND transporter periplasmic adaptor subunit [Bacteroidales bacterium]|jgi:cobalt-zinc-cadmium efflux system membrane fusion protein|nr:efflux RND transporter periplasmic adaptor subunit [Bacteroidales bacterium]
MMYKLILIFLIVFFAACQNSENQKPEPKVNSHGKMGHQHRRNRGNNYPVESNNAFVSGDTAFLSSGSLLRTKLKMYTVNNQDYNAQFTTTGVVKPLPGHMAQVASPFEGRIVRSFITLGQKVNTGFPLFEVTSSDYLEYVKTFFQAKRQRELAEKNYQRKKDLLETGISSKREFEEAKLEFDLAEQEYDKSAAILKILGLDPEKADLTQPLIVRSPITGEIVKTDITVGQYIKSDAEAIVTIADINKIWVVANVKEKDLGAISLNDQVEIFIESMPDHPIKGVVNYIGDIMNQETRSVEVFIECQNPVHSLKCGMFVTVRFYHKLKDAIIIPASSVLQDYDQSYLFVQLGQEVFVKKQVTVNSIGDRKLIVHSGLKTGDIIISEGGIYLR